MTWPLVDWEFFECLTLYSDADVIVEDIMLRQQKSQAAGIGATT